MSDETEQKAGDACTNADGVAGVLQDDGQGNLVCVVEETPAPQAGDVCTLPDGTEGALQADGNGGLECVAKPAPESVVPTDAQQGDACVCPDGRNGTYQPVGDDAGALVCLPNEA